MIQEYKKIHRKPYIDIFFYFTETQRRPQDKHDYSM